MKPLPLITVLLVTLAPVALSGQIAESQKKFIEVYKKQPNVPKPEAMLINTDPEPDLTKDFTSLYNGRNLDGWVPRGGDGKFEARGEVMGGGRSLTFIRGVISADARPVLSFSGTIKRRQGKIESH